MTKCSSADQSETGRLCKIAEAANGEEALDIEKKRIEAGMELPEEIAFYGNPELLEQVWINLLGNAVKFTPENREISISAQIEDTVVHISISDSGIGMDRETRAHIFEKYYQYDAGHTAQGNGIGCLSPTVLSRSAREKSRSPARPAGAVRLPLLCLLDAPDGYIAFIIMHQNERSREMSATCTVSAAGRRSTETI